MDSSEFLGFLTSRTSVRRYGTDPLTGDEIAYILDCASTAPSAGNLEAWDVVIVTEEDTKSALSGAAFDQAHIEQAPAVFVVCANYVRSMSRYGERGILYAVQDATIAGAYMMLAAHAKSIHSCWTGAFDENEVRSILDLPQHIRPIVMLAAGRGNSSACLTERMPVGEHAHYEIW
jgi:nitroreductase